MGGKKKGSKKSEGEQVAKACRSRYLRVDLVCLEALSACCALLFLDSLYTDKKLAALVSLESTEMFRLSLIVIGAMAAGIGLVYRFALGVRVLRSSYQRCKLKDFSYLSWAKVVNCCVSRHTGRVDWRKLSAMRLRLSEFVAMVGWFGPSSTPWLFATENDKLAFYLNAYNAMVVLAVVRYWPIGSVLDIRTGLCGCSSALGGCELSAVHTANGRNKAPFMAQLCGAKQSQFVARYPHVLKRFAKCKSCQLLHFHANWSQWQQTKGRVKGKGKAKAKAKAKAQRCDCHSAIEHCDDVFICHCHCVCRRCAFLTTGMATKGKHVDNDGNEINDPLDAFECSHCGGQFVCRCGDGACHCNPPGLALKRVLAKAKASALARSSSAARTLRRSELELTYWFFEALRFEVDGALVSLWEMERTLLKPFIDRDARVAAALFKAAAGSPRLAADPFDGGPLLDAQLNQCNALLCSGLRKRDVCVRHKSKLICLNKVFKTYRNQFVTFAQKNNWTLNNNLYDIRTASLLGYVWHFADDQMREMLRVPLKCGYALKFVEFDWSLPSESTLRRANRKKYSKAQSVSSVG